MGRPAQPAARVEGDPSRAADRTRPSRGTSGSGPPGRNRTRSGVCFGDEDIRAAFAEHTRLRGTSACICEPPTRGTEDLPRPAHSVPATLRRWLAIRANRRHITSHAEGLLTKFQGNDNLFDVRRFRLALQTWFRPLHRAPCHRLRRPWYPRSTSNTHVLLDQEGF